MKFRHLIREPLLHFLLIGAVLFFIYDLRSGYDDVAPNRIVVSEGQQKNLVASFNRTWMRSPTEEELAGLIDNYVREEVFYREAMAMGLDQDDPMVRQRMRMKLEYLLEDLSAQSVSDAVLATFLATHPEKFQSETKLSFQQVFLNPDKHKELDSHAQTILASLNNGAAPESVGDQTLTPYEFHLATLREIEHSLGRNFAADVIKLSPGDWTGPIYSSYGAHLVKVSQRVDARQPELAEIRDLVKREYLVQQRADQKNLVYKKLLDNYDVIIEPLTGNQAPTSDGAATAKLGE